jgi:hypothetical protein
MDSDGDRVIVGAPGDISATILIRSEQGWEVESNLIPNDGAAGSAFGQSVAIRDRLAAVGAPLMDRNEYRRDSGAVYILEHFNSGWHQIAKIEHSDGNKDDKFGTAVAFDGSCVLIGAPSNVVFLLQEERFSYRYGTLFSFCPKETHWVENQKILSPYGGIVPNYKGRFASALAISGDTLAVGSPDEKGSAFVYKKNGVTGEWIYQTTIVPQGSTSLADRFGTSLSLSDGLLAVGAPEAERFGSGAVYLYREVPGGWEEQAKLHRYEYWPTRDFGTSVFLANDRLFVGDPGAEEGVIHVFRSAQGEWQLDTSIVQPGDSRYSYFGRSLTFSQNSLLVGAPEWDRLDEQGGGVFVFEEEEAFSWKNIGSISRLNNTPAGDFSGKLIAADDDTLVVGGSVVTVYSRNSDNDWVLETELGYDSLIYTPSNYSTTRTYYGSDVATANGTVIVGMPFGLPYDPRFSSIHTGRILVYEKKSGEWVKGQTISCPGKDSRCGYSLAFDGEDLFVADVLDGNYPAIHVYTKMQWEGVSYYDWIQTLYEELPQSNFSRHAMSVNAGFFVIGDKSSGVVSVFEKKDDRWSITQVLRPREEESTGFGKAVVLERDLLVVTSDERVHIFERQEGWWNETQTLWLDIPTQQQMNFGSSVALLDNLLAVGSAHDVNDDSEEGGEVLIFERTGKIWNARGFFRPDFRKQGDGIGSSVAISGQTVFVGAPGVDHPRMNDVGAVYRVENTPSLGDICSGDEDCREWRSFGLPCL